MSGIKVGANETIDSALRRFKRETAKSGVMAEIKKESITRSLVLSVRRSLKLLEERTRRKLFNFFKSR